MRVQLVKTIEIGESVKKLPRVDDFVIRIVSPQASKSVAKENLLVPEDEDNSLGLIKSYKPLVKGGTNVC